MRALVRYLLITTVLVAIAWAAVSVKVGGRTFYGHVRSIGDEQFENVLEEIKHQVDKRLAERKAPKLEPKKAQKAAAAKRPAAKAEPAQEPQAERIARDKRVDNLRKAAEALNAQPAQPSSKVQPQPQAAKPKTRTDEKISAKSEKSLDELLDKSVARLR